MRSSGRSTTGAQCPIPALFTRMSGVPASRCTALGHLEDRLGIRDVASERHGRGPAEARQLLGCGGQPRLRAGDEDQPRSGAGQGPGRGEPDPGRPAGHDREAIGQWSRHR